MDSEMLARLEGYLAQPEAELRARHASHMRAYVERLDRTIASGWEALWAEREVIHSPQSIEHPLYLALVGLEARSGRLVASLSSEEQQTYRAGFDQRYDQAVADWRDAHGYLRES